MTSRFVYVNVNLSCRVNVKLASALHDAMHGWDEPMTNDTMNIRDMCAAFDVTPRRLVTGLITERGVADPSAAGLAALFPERVLKENDE